MKSAKTMRDQLFAVRQKFRPAAKKSIVLPNELTFNRAGTKHFDQVLNTLNWNLHNIPIEIDFSKCQSANYQAMALLILYCWKLKQQN